MKIQNFTCDPIVIEPIRDRWYLIQQDTEIKIKHEDGIFIIHVDAGFEFDGRSGGPLADYFVPNLGTQSETACWLVHDVLGHDFGISFESTNEILRQMLVLAGVGKFKAFWVKRAVSLSRTWFGCDTEEDEINKKYCKLKWCPNERG